MCLALPTGRQPDASQNVLQRLWQRLGFSALLVRLFAAGLWIWLKHRWNTDRSRGRRRA